MFAEVAFSLAMFAEVWSGTIDSYADMATPASRRRWTTRLAEDGFDPSTSGPSTLPLRHSALHYVVWDLNTCID